MDLGATLTAAYWVLQQVHLHCPGTGQDRQVCTPSLSWDRTGRCPLGVQPQHVQ